MYIIKVYENVQLMTGEGEEILVDKDGEVRAVFIDGNIKLSCQYGCADEETKITA